MVGLAVGQPSVNLTLVIVAINALESPEHWVPGRRRKLRGRGQPNLAMSDQAKTPGESMVGKGEV